MKFKLVFFFVLFFGNDLVVETRETEDFSYYATVHIADGLWKVCGGILITDRYVITPADCVSGESWVDVRLDFDEFYRISSRNQIIRSEKIFVHEDHSPFNESNNIALVKLSKPAILSTNVQPAKLITVQEAERLGGKFANISGKIEFDKYHYVNYAATQIGNKTTCKDLYENQIEEDQLLCIHMVPPFYKSLHGNAISVGNKVVGFTAKSCSYNSKSKDGVSSCLVPNVVPFLEWMSQKMNIPIEQFTSQDKHNLSKTENSGNNFTQNIQKRLDELQEEIKDNQIKEDQHFMQVQEGITNILKKMDDLNKGQLKIKHRPKKNSTVNIHNNI